MLAGRCHAGSPSRYIAALQALGRRAYCWRIWAPWMPRSPPATRYWPPRQPSTDSDPFDRARSGGTTCPSHSGDRREHAADEAITRTGRALGPGAAVPRWAPRSAGRGPVHLHTPKPRRARSGRSRALLRRRPPEADCRPHRWATARGSRPSPSPMAAPRRRRGSPALNPASAPPRPDRVPRPGVVAAHPDDETLGLGATIATLVAAGVDVQVVSAQRWRRCPTRARPRSRPVRATTRRHELRRAAGVLSVPEPVSLGLPDGRAGRSRGQLTDLLTGILANFRTGAGVLPPGAATGIPITKPSDAPRHRRRRTGAELLEYPVWMWHWASPSDPAVPWDRARASPLSDSAIARKRQAAQCFRSQFEQGIAGRHPCCRHSCCVGYLTVGELVFG